MAGKKLLVADDSLTIQKVIRLALSNEGYEIQAVSDGNDAIQQISLFRPDAVLIDVSLPGKTAFEVKRAINEHSDLEEVRFILMSSAFEKVDEPQATEVRFHGRLTKPFDPAHLRQVLIETLAQVDTKRREPTALIQKPAAASPQTPAAPQNPAFTQVSPGPQNPTLAPGPATPQNPMTAPLSPPPLPGTPSPTFSNFSAPFDPPPRLPPLPSGPATSLSQSPPSALPPLPSHEIEIAITADDDWLKPVQSNEPILSPTSHLESKQLWDNEPTLSMDVAQKQIAAGRTPPPPSSSVALDSNVPHGSDRDADIKHLTESTIRMSGLDDFEWSVSEPSLKPPSQMLDVGGANFQIELPGTHPESDFEPFNPSSVPSVSSMVLAPHATEVDSPSLAGIMPPTAEVQNASSPSDFYRDPADITQRLTRPTAFTPSPVAPQSALGRETFSSTSPIPPPPGYASAPEASVVGISPEQIEELLRKELQKILPDLAEKLIKQEIHRMLSDST